MGETKLTKPQRELLEQIGKAAQPIHESYRPGRALVAAGYAEWQAGRYTDWMRITEAGRKALRKTS